ncbi:hypothetical protein [Bifidobacterium sp. SO1]|uniref:hypothetical protein n=1 Tax=Bifidobacterium sp. SO1 TaxID=2809029 RepID=UPI001F0AD9E2|nr:hypothetical protein [Bifidobacterium sp. SO1]
MPRRKPERYTPRPLKADATFNRKCGRTTFKSPIDAQIALGKMPEGKVARKCPNCGGYHIVNVGEHLESRKANGGGKNRHRNRKEGK